MHQSFRVSVVVSTDSTFDVVRRSIELLTDQTAVDQIHIVLVGPSIEKIEPDFETLSKFGAYDIVEFGEFDTTGAALQAGMRKAKGEFLVYLEEHGFPPNDFIEKLIARFDETGSDVVGYGLLPSNPGTVSWAHIYIQFGGAVPPRPSGYQKRLGPHHVSYRIAAVLGDVEYLDDLLSNEAAFHEKLRNEGKKLYFCGDIALDHAQISDFRQLFVHEFLSGVTYGDSRHKAQNWSVLRRAIYVCGAPLIPFWRTVRAMADMKQSGRLLALSPMTPLVMFAVSCAGAAGEVVGYTVGANKEIKDRRSGFELDRFAYVNAADMKSAPRTAEDVRKSG